MAEDTADDESGAAAIAAPLTYAEQNLYVDLQSRSLVQFSNQDLGEFLSLRYRADLESGRQRFNGEEVEFMAQKAAGTPYRLYSSRFDLAESDCVVHVERSIAMALATDWTSYHKICERLRHKNGVVEYTNRNRFTLCEWVPNNAWALDDITPTLAGGQAFDTFEYVIRPKRFIGTQFVGADYASPNKQHVLQTFIPRDRVEWILGELQPGDVCLVIREYTKEGLKPWYDCDHMGLIGYGSTFIHSAPPVVREQELTDFLRRYKFVAGFKFLRLREDATAQLALELPQVSSEPPSPAQLDDLISSLRQSRQASE